MAPQPCAAFLTSSGLVSSPSKTSIPLSASRRARLPGRTSARTEWPAAASACARWLPTNPVAPVTSTFISGSVPLELSLRGQARGQAQVIHDERERHNRPREPAEADPVYDADDAPGRG